MTKILTATPASLDFGTQQIGQPAAVLTVELASTGTLIPTVTGATISGDGAAAFSGGDPAETDYPVSVSIGKIWQALTSDLPPRRNFGFTKKGDYFYVVGGRNDLELFNDCWRSTDGLTWTQMTAAAFDEARTDLALFYVGDNLYAVGGLKNGVVTDEIWVSTDDGATWALDAAVLTGGIAKMGYAQDDTTLAIYGGVDENGDLSDSFWTSTDGLTWSEADTQAPGERSDCLLVRVPSGTYVGWYVMGGDDGADLLDDCWVKTGAGAFTDTGSHPFAGHARIGAAVIANELAIVLHGGSTDKNALTTTASGQLRYSANGAAGWSTIHTTDTKRTFHAFGQTTAGKLALIAGIGDDGER